MLRRRPSKKKDPPSPPMERAPPAMQLAPESVNQLLLSFSSIPTQDPTLRWTQQEQQEEVGVADWEEIEHNGGSWIQTEQQFHSPPTRADPSPWIEEALSAS